MKLSEAILEGCKITEPNTNGNYFNAKEITCACAIGAAILILYPNSPHETGFSEIQKATGANMWDVTAEYLNRYGVSLFSDNDKNKLPREQIAARIAALGY